jgi:hypothetical protein
MHHQPALILTFSQWEKELPLPAGEGGVRVVEKAQEKLED